MPLGHALAWFGGAGVVLFVFAHFGIPVLERAGLEPFAAYLLALLVPLAAMMVVALALLPVEGRSVSWASIRERYRFRRMNAADWWWSAGAVVVGFVGLTLVGGVTALLITAGVVPLPDSLPTPLDPRLGAIEGLLASVTGSLVGRWDLVLLYGVVFFFNVAGEELLWRGYVLPCQEAAHGRSAWVVHGLLWSAFHFFKWWEVLALLPVTLALAFVCQRRRSSTPGLVIHAVINGVGLLGFTAIVAGWVG